MPYFSDSMNDFVPTDTTVTDEISRDVFSAPETNQSRYKFNIAQQAGYSVIGAITDFVDMVGSSVPVVSSALGADRGDFNKYMTRSLDLPGLAAFYEQNKGGLEIASGLGGILASELVTRKVTAPGSLLMSQLRKVPYLRRIAAIDDQYEAAMNTVRALDKTLTGRGAMGAAQMNGVGTVNSMIWSSSAGAMVPGSVTLSRASAVNRAKGLGALTGVRHAAISEGVAATIANQNSFLFDDSASYNLMMAGLGLGVGAGVDWLHSAYRIRKGVHNADVTRALAGALDPMGDEATRTRGLFSRSLADSPEYAESIKYFGGANTDLVTQYSNQINALRSATLDTADDPNALKASRESFATQLMTQRREAMQKVTTQGISTDGRTRFSMNAPGYADHANLLMERDAGSMYLLEQLGGVPKDSSAHAIINHRQSKLASDEARLTNEIDVLTQKISNGKNVKEKDVLKLEKLQLRMRQLGFAKTQTPMVAISGEWLPPSAAAPFIGFVEPKITPVPLENGRFIMETDAESVASRVVLDSELLLTMPGGKSMDNADMYDVLRGYRVADKAIDRFANGSLPMILPKNPTWFQLDMAEEVLRRNPAAKVQFSGKLTRESAQVESLIQKAEAIKKLSQRGLTKAQIKAGETEETLMAKLRVRFNLPQLTAYERGVLGTDEHPIDFILRGMGEYSADHLRTLTLDEIKDGVAQVKRLGDMSEVTKADVKSLTGDSFRFMQDDKGQPLPVLLGFKRPAQPFEWTREHLAERLATNQLQTITSLLSDSRAALSQTLVKTIMGSADFAAASRPDELLETMIQGSLTGSNHLDWFGAMTKELKTSEQNFRDAPTLLAAGRINDTVSRVTADQMKRDIDAAFGDTLNLLANPHNAGTNALLDQFHSIRSGWDLEDEAVDLGDGFYGFKLSDTEANRRRWTATRGSEMPKGQLLESIDGKRVALDQLGMRAQQAFNAVTNKLLAEKNSLLRSLGRSEIRSQNHFVPVQGLDGKHVGFVMGPDNKIVPDMAVIAESEADFARMRAEVEAKLDSLPGGGMGYTFRTQDQIRNFMDIWDRAEMDMINPGVTAVQPGKKSKGALVGPGTRVGAFGESLKYLQDQYLQHGNDVIRALMRNNIKSAEARSVVSRNLSKNAERRAQSFRNVHDYYLQELLGRPKHLSESSIIGSRMAGVEEVIDGLLAVGHKHGRNVWQATELWLRDRVPGADSVASRKTFVALSSELGNYMPFKDALDMAERTARGAVPPTLGKITNKLNQVTAALMLRVMEVGQPVMNLAGILNAMPSVIRQFEPRAGEDAAAFAARVGHHATIFNVGNEQIATLDMVKIAKRGFQRAWSRESHADYDYMVRRGYLTQEVAEFNKQFSVIERKGAAMRVITGDPHSANPFARKGIVGSLSVLSDRSEDFSRSWGHMIGLEMADVLGITGRDARNMFAHDIANKMIANYSPHNRPEIFQGALGAPLGLFQSFILNYYQRIFRAIESKDARTLATQVATQSTLFGLTGLPGYAEMASFVSAISDGERNMESGIHGMMDPGPASILAHGVLSSIPKLFGQEGIDLYGRGDTSVRIPGMGDSTIPGYSVAAKILGGIGEGLRSFMDENPGMTRTRAAEILSNMVVNRPLAGMLEQFGAGGIDTDRYGQVVSETKSWAERIYRMMGLRSERQSMQAAAFYLDKQAAEDKASRDELLRTQTRAAIRENREDLLPGIFEQYVQNGGDPKHFRRWLKNNAEAATVNRSERRLNDLMNNPANFSRVMRMIDMGVGVDDDEAVGDPTESYGIPPDELDQPTTSLGAYEGQVSLTTNPGYEGDSQPGF